MFARPHRFQSVRRTMLSGWSVFAASAAALAVFATILANPASDAVATTPATTPAEQPPAPPADTIQQPEKLFARPHTTEADTTMLFWTGKVVPTMAQQIWQAFEAHKATTRRFVLVLNSGGGLVQEGERVIAVMRGIRVTHRLDTEVRNGQMCGSMCVFIYLQGQSRTAGPSSAWLFHEITRPDPIDKQRLIVDRAASERLLIKYYPEAGVSLSWTDQMRPKTVNADYWQTGLELMQSHTGIVKGLLPNTQPRILGPAKPAMAAN